MKIIFAGTPAFAATTLSALIKAKHEIILVLTQPDRPAGRGMKKVASAVKTLAEQHNLALLQPTTLKAPDIQAQLRILKADVMVVASYGLILPEIILDIPRLGCLNIHASLLPRWRGAAPIQRAILAGDHETGITVMQMNAGLDTGTILLTHRLAIALEDTTQSLHDKLSLLGSESIIEALVLLQQGKITPVVQNEMKACYASKIERTEAVIDWHKSVHQVDRIVRAFNPTPGAYTFFQEKVLKIWQARIISVDKGKPGEIVAVNHEGITVACYPGMLRIEMVQKPGGRKMDVRDFLAGNNVQPGDYFSAMKDSVA